MQQFARNLQERRKARGLTQSEVARQLFVTSQAVSAWECGESAPDIGKLCALSRLLAVSMDALLGNRPEQKRCLIGIDGGGTKTEFVLIDETGCMLDRVLLGGSNPNTCGIEESVRVVCRGIEILRPAERRVAGIFVGGAGLGAADHAKAMRGALEQVYPEVQVDCGADILNVIACGSAPDSCIAAICGTGSAVFASVGGRLIQTGGSGYLFDSAASGYGLGRAAIAAALEDRDGTGPATALTGLVEEKLGGGVWRHIQQLYKKDVSCIASFAPLVQTACEQGDPVAREILEGSSRRLARLIAVAARKAPEARSLVLSGSLLQKSELFYRMLAEKLPPDLEPEVLTCPPVWGACLQCAKLCGVTQPPSLELFMEQYSAGAKSGE